MSAVLKIRGGCEVPRMKWNLSEVGHVYLLAFDVKHGTVVPPKDSEKAIHEEMS